MKTISSHVTTYMKNRPLLIKYLNRGIINYRALAKYIEPDISKAKGEKVSIAAIAISLQRLASNKMLDDIKTIGTLKGTTIYSDLLLISARDDALLPSDILDKKGAVSLVRTDTESSVIVSKKVWQEIEPDIPNRAALKIITDLTAVCVEREGNNLELSGALAYPLNVLLENNIPVLSVVSTQNQELLLLKDIHADKAAQLLRKAVFV